MIRRHSNIAIRPFLGLSIARRAAFYEHIFRKRSVAPVLQ
jgi:hypothetical protein